ncbi:hypothetical protein PUR61_05425 [Streptomyces sp. BE20]|uniref:hypothetical protein n=1 Tax=Streptomyces sp. BE20 TaxID=3002525 RepID=UPI002E7A31B9|nr:hypothetical protein [Streptomyces sp. BE20]MEE1821639.1 hypothetical protein [Streptomyces sp. BE20]
MGAGLTLANPPCGHSIHYNCLQQEPDVCTCGMPVDSRGMLASVDRLQAQPAPGAMDVDDSPELSDPDEEMGEQSIECRACRQETVHQEFQSWRFTDLECPRCGNGFANSTTHVLVCTSCKTVTHYEC